ncbi:MAG: hypothetical protein HC875_08950 [Anaerolineales bacterium]|nr:hypothetical protein [Anaerolineales bacterium]
MGVDIPAFAAELLRRYAAEVQDIWLAPVQGAGGVSKNFNRALTHRAKPVTMVYNQREQSQ